MAGVILTRRATTTYAAHGNNSIITLKPYEFMKSAFRVADVVARRRYSIQAQGPKAKSNLVRISATCNNICRVESGFYEFIKQN